MNVPLLPTSALHSPGPASTPHGPSITFENLSLTLGRTQILSDLNLHIEASNVHAIVGPNGGGKSSLVRCLLGQAPHGGTIRIGWPGEPGIVAPGIIGYVPQALEFDRGLPMTVMDFLVALVSNRPACLSPKASVKETILAALARVGMEGKACRRMGALSGGERQRVMLAQGLMPEPGLLVLDEPMAALDEAGARIFETVIGELAARGVTIVWIEHDLAAVRRLASRVTGLSRTILFDGPPETELTPERVISLFSHRAGGAS
ncbi:metal ABC transporter ATP-binding protein [Aquamicrobium lusatiense]|uniref:metal ABC transporter ATP-binding protein n=1 Tax=Aquamicrobium lusatiense TaxID=89772 RepID=UPI0024565407|nr:metal ABC transporter ATP-binding protein [Aquamicrobium lusatiense]MDH4990676.1 metal ABC transporter ATP-binding protein [Aquamicrobium lusatiense]